MKHEDESTECKQLDEGNKEASLIECIQQLRRHLNPRLVFADPDAFFNDLLLEQQEGI